MKYSKSVLTDAQLAAIGCIAVESARLESLLDIMISSIANLSEAQGSVFLSNAMLAAKMDILRDLGLLKLKSKSKRAELQRIISDLKHLNSQRTIAIHGLWTTKGGVPLAKDAQATHKRRNNEPSTLTAAKLQNIATAIGDSFNELLNFWIYVWVQPSVRRQLSKSRPKAQ